METPQVVFFTVFSGTALTFTASSSVTHQYKVSHAEWVGLEWAELEL